MSATVNATAPKIMGILNVTPDSFSDGGQHSGVEAALAFARKMVADGADIIDIGGESTRPGSLPVDEKEEFRRVIPVVEAIRTAGISTPLSIDTRHASVARAALERGAAIINDVSAFESEPAMADIVRDFGAICILMHGYTPNQGTGIRVVIDYLRTRIDYALSRGIPREKIIVDPGFGFNKNTAENCALLTHLGELKELGVPFLAGLSRKRFIGALTGEEIPEKRLAGSLAGALLAAQSGAAILRVHDVQETKQAISLLAACVNSAMH